jgi:transcriptional regulator with XRE-family HTH domain
MRRKLLGVSQEQLADSLGLTFQQVQKYERGANRVSASKLYEIAKTLQVPVSFFFDGLADPMDGSDGDEVGQQAERIVQEFLTTPEGLELAEVFPKIGRGRVRRQVSTWFAPWLKKPPGPKTPPPDRGRPQLVRSGPGDPSPGPDRF